MQSGFEIAGHQQKTAYETELGGSDNQLILWINGKKPRAVGHADPAKLPTCDTTAGVLLGSGRLA
jgi:hypothetical protein